MKRRLNFTGREKIPRRRISVVLNRQDGAVRSFTANFNLSDFEFPPDAKVYFEAYHRTDQRRYHFGTVGAIRTPQDTSLENLARIENLRFRLLIVDERGTHGLILAHSKGISPLPEGDRKPILPVDFKDLGQQVWKVNYDGAEGGPVITFNNKIPNIQTMVKSDPLFLFFVFPSAIREVLTHMVYVDGVDSVEDPSVDWHADWLQFARMVHSGLGPPSVLDPRADNFDSEEVERWIEAVVEEFCACRRDREWSQFSSKLARGDAQ